MSDLTRSGRAANGVDVLVSVLLGLLTWPFPVARHLLTPSIHVLAVVAWVLFVASAYCFLTLVRWHRTLGMYLFDLRLPNDARATSILRWVAGWVVVAVPALVLGQLVDPTEGVPSRVSGIVAEAQAPRSADSGRRR